MAEHYQVGDHARPHTTPGERISYLAGKSTVYDAADPGYWDEALLKEEVDRAFEICHGCRMCFKYCDAFPTLFELLDKKHDGDVTKLGAEETNRVMDACFQCKLCEIQGPYTPRDKHEFQLDFPKLVHRHQAIRAREEGTSLGDKFLGDPDLTGKLARASLGAVNTLNQVKLHRWFMEKVLGIHRDKLLPEFAPQGFEQWADQSGKIAAEPGGEAVLFQTCYVEHNEPQIGKDTCEVMARNGVDLRCAAGLRCCGMPAWEHGDLVSLRKNARKNLDVLMPFVERGAKVLAINPTCSMMLRREYPDLLEGADRERATRLAAAVMDPSEFLWTIRREPRFAGTFASSPHGQVAYHTPCHLRAQAVGFKGRDLIKRLPGVQVTTVTECCGHDGTYAMRVEGFEPSQRIGKKAFEGMRGAEATTWVTDCPLAAIQFEQHAGTRPLHPMSLLARAYRGDSFGPGETDETKEE